MLFCPVAGPKLRRGAARTLCNQITKEGENLENYTKYRLKDIGELAPFLAETDDIFVVASNK